MNILIAVPTRGLVHWATVTRLNEIRDAHPGTPPIIFQSNHISVTRTRNLIVERFMETTCEALFMVDDDVVPPKHMLDITKHLGPYDMVSIPHPFNPRDHEPKTTMFGIYEKVDGKYRFLQSEWGVHECDAVATGCFVVSRRALEALGPNPFRMGDNASDYTDDFNFCSDLQSHGFKIGYVWDGHYADHIVNVSLQAILENP